MKDWIRLMIPPAGKRYWNGRSDLDAGLLVLGGLGLGAGLMYMLDPNRGRRRRALARDRLIHAAHVITHAAGTTSRDLSHRANGLWAEGSRMLRRDHASDEVLTARVRAALGRAVSHPHAINVNVDDGHVTVSGAVLADEVDDLLSRVSRVRGVRSVKNRLTIHQDATGVSDLQGGRERQARGSGFNQANWTPTARLFAGLAGGMMMTWCLARRDAVGVALGTLGFGLFIRGLTNQEMKSILGVGESCRAIEVQKTINLNAPVEQVFAFWTDYQNFPRFMSNVREVRRTGPGRSHWTVTGPAGVPVEWEAEVVEIEPNRYLAWRSVPGSVIDCSGTIDFESRPEGGTRVHIRLQYVPIGGLFGHALARLFGADPKSEMDADLVRMKTLIETGHPPHDAAYPLPRGRAAALTQSGSR